MLSKRPVSGSAVSHSGLDTRSSWRAIVSLNRFHLVGIPLTRRETFSQSLFFLNFLSLSSEKLFLELAVMPRVVKEQV